MASSLEERAEALDTIYADLPALDCKGLCHESCGPFTAFPAEHQRLIHQHGKAPALDAWTCPLLVNKKCRAYPHRPLLCRLFGLINDQRFPPCPFGCVPERWLTYDEGLAFVERVLEVPVS